jgi:hypothetical protein
LEHFLILNPPSYLAKAVVHQPQFDPEQSVVNNLSLLSALLLL